MWALRGGRRAGVRGSLVIGVAAFRRMDLSPFIQGPMHPPMDLLWCRLIMGPSGQWCAARRPCVLMCLRRRGQIPRRRSTVVLGRLEGRRRSTASRVMCMSPLRRRSTAGLTAETFPGEEESRVLSLWRRGGRRNHHLVGPGMFPSGRMFDPPLPRERWGKSHLGALPSILRALRGSPWELSGHHLGEVAPCSRVRGRRLRLLFLLDLSQFVGAREVAPALLQNQRMTSTTLVRVMGLAAPAQERMLAICRGL